MTKRKSIQVKTKTRKIEPIQTGKTNEQEDTSKQAFDTMMISNAIEQVQTEYSVSIGVQLDIKKIGEILDHMIENGLKTVSIKFEIWKNQP